LYMAPTEFSGLNLRIRGQFVGADAPHQDGAFGAADYVHPRGMVEWLQSQGVWLSTTGAAAGGGEGGKPEPANAARSFAKDGKFSLS
jgi:hypothetical protein